MHSHSHSKILPDRERETDCASQPNVALLLPLWHPHSPRAPPGRATWHNKHLPIDRILTEAISLFGRRASPALHAACPMTDMPSTSSSASTEASSSSASHTATYAAKGCGHRLRRAEQGFRPCQNFWLQFNKQTGSLNIPLASQCSSQDAAVGTGSASGRGRGSVNEVVGRGKCKWILISDRRRPSWQIRQRSQPAKASAQRALCRWLYSAV